MKKVCAFILLLVFSFIELKAQEQDPWAVYMTPTKVHSMMGNYTGDFILEIRMPMSQGNEDSPIRIDSKNTMTLGGRFLEMNAEGDMMGMEFQSVMVLGYNTISKQMALNTITNMGTGMLSLVGDWNPETQSADLLGELTNPVTKEIIQVRQTISFLDADTIQIDSYDREGDNPEVLTVQYRILRKLD